MTRRNLRTCAGTVTDGTLDYEKLIPVMDRLAPDAPRILEYIRPAMHGEPLIEDAETLRKLSAAGEEAGQDAGKPGETAELSHAHMNYILKSMNEAVCLTSMDGELIYANRAAEKLFGIRAGDRKRIWDAIPFEKGNDALIQLFIDGIMKKRKSIRSLADYVNSNGERFHLHVSLTCDDVENGMYV